jgi:hypothetical protein
MPVSITSLTVTVTDCKFSIFATPAPYPGVPSPPQQLIGTINASGTTCEKGSVSGCNITERHSTATTNLVVGADGCLVELDVTSNVSGPCAELQCTVKIFDPDVTSKLKVSGTASATVAGITINATFKVEPKPTVANANFSVSVCCVRSGDGCTRDCKLVNPPDGKVI